MHVLPTVLADPDVYPYLKEPVLANGDARDRAYRQLGDFVHRALANGIGAQVILEDGDVVEEVLKKAKSLGADLVVMGTHGRRGFQRLVLGSVTERVLRQSETPVLSISPSARRIETDRSPESVPENPLSCGFLSRLARRAFGRSGSQPGERGAPRSPCRGVSLPTGSR
jgi:hypothetical protein